jgi:hypothetical protein
MACSGHEIQDPTILPSGANGYCVIESVPRRNSGTGFPEPGSAKAAHSIATVLKQGRAWPDGTSATGEYDLTLNMGGDSRTQNRRDKSVKHARSAQRKVSHAG